MQQDPAKKSRKPLIIILCLVLVVLIAGGGLLLAFGKDLFRKKAPIPQFISQDIRAMRLAAPPDTNNAATRLYFEEAARFAGENGFNTILFEAKSGAAVYWRDKIFPAAAGLEEQDSLFKRYDPLNMLCEITQQAGIQLWLEIDPYASGSVPAGAKARVLDIPAATEDGGFAADDAAYTTLLVESLSALPEYYPIAGMVFAVPQQVQTTGTDGFTTAFHSTLQQLHTGLANTGRLVPLAVSFNHNASALTTPYLFALQQEGLISYCLPLVTSAGDFVSALSDYAAQGGYIAVQPPDDDGLVLFAASHTAQPTGYLFGSYAQLSANPAHLQLLSSALTTQDAPLPAAFDIPQYLNITYPAEGRTLTWSDVYITGHSNPGYPLYIDGAEITNRAPNGAFGVFVPLAVGENRFTFTNGDMELIKTIQRQTPTPSTSTPTEDGTQEAEEGQAVRIVPQIASALTDYTNLSSINETFIKGGVAVVQSSVRYRSGSSYTHAYQLASGDWVLASNCEWVSDDGQSQFTGLAAVADAGGEYLNFEGSGTPVAYLAYNDETGQLAITMYDTTMQLPGAFQSQHVSAASVETIDGGVVLTLQTNGIWGYSLEYENDTTRLYLKKTPTLSADPAKPLTGVHILLDPGHGQQTQGSAYGAVGIAGESGYPHEKDINLALAQVVAYRLEQLGATVSFTRSDDSNPSLDVRLAMQTELKPDLFLSLHHDGLDGNIDLSDRDRLLSYYFHPYNTPPSKAFAQNLMQQMQTYTGRSGEDAGWGYYYVTRTTVCPSVLFEYGLIVNPNHYYQATSQSGIYQAAFATVDAILQTITAA